MEHTLFYIILSAIVLFALFLAFISAKVNIKIAREAELEAFKKLQESEAATVDYSEFAETE